MFLLVLFLVVVVLVVVVVVVVGCSLTSPTLGCTLTSPNPRRPVGPERKLGAPDQLLAQFLWKSLSFADLSVAEDKVAVQPVAISECRGPRSGPSLAISLTGPALIQGSVVVEVVVVVLVWSLTGLKHWDILLWAALAAKIVGCTSTSLNPRRLAVPEHKLDAPDPLHVQYL